MKKTTRKIRPRIYVVDDDPIVLRGLQLALEKSYDISCFSTALGALEKVKAAAPNAIILDIKMPDHDGLWLCRQVRALGNIPIIFNSAYQDFVFPEDLKGAFRPFAILPKTGKLQELIDVIESALLV